MVWLLMIRVYLLLSKRLLMIVCSQCWKHFDPGILSYGMQEAKSGLHLQTLDSQTVAEKF
jgi:hypothetical protein